MLLYVYLRYAFNNGSEEAGPGDLRQARLNDALEYISDPFENDLPPLEEVFEEENEEYGEYHS